MFRYGKLLLIILCSWLCIFSSSAIASNLITPDTKARIRIQTLITHGEIMVFDTTVKEFEKILIKEITPKHSYATSFSVVLENSSHAEAFKDTTEFLNYRTRFKCRDGYIFSLTPVEPIIPQLLPELLEQGFTRNARMFLMSMSYQNNHLQHSKEKK